MGFSIPPPGVPRDVLLALQSFKELKDWLVSFEDCRPSWALSSFLGHRGDPGSDTLTVGSLTIDTARRLVFVNLAGARVEVEAELPKDLRTSLARLRKYDAR